MPRDLIAFVQRTPVAVPRRLAILLGVALLAIGSVPAAANESDPADRSGTPVSEALDEDDDVDREGESLLGRLGLGLEMDIELAHAREAGATDTGFTLDDIGISWTRSWIAASVTLVYESSGGGELTADDARLRLGGADRAPFYTELGKLVMPFGDHDSHFIEDPLVTLLAETQDNAVLIGYEHDHVALAAGGFTAEHDDHDDVVFVAGVTSPLNESLELGVTFTSDMGESVEIRDLRTARGLPAGHDEDTAGGVSAFLSLHRDPWLTQVSFVSAFERFDEGVITGGTAQPAAWNVEVGVHPLEGMTVAGRLAGSRDFPGAADVQTGVVAAYELTDWLTGAGEYLHETLRGATPNRRLISFVMSLSF